MTLTGKERVRRALQGETLDRPATGPLAVHFCAAQAGATLEEYTLEPRRLAAAVVSYHERFRPDAVWVSADTWVTAEAMGAEVAFPSPRQPLGGTGKPLVRCSQDIDRIPPADPARQGRMPIMIEALEEIRRAVGEEAFVVACFDQLPFSLACAVMGISQLMLALVEDGALVDALLDRCVEYSAAYGEALGRAGADMLSGGDSPAGLIGPERYREVALPAERRVFERLRSVTEVPLSLHVCGKATPILTDMATSGAEVLEIDQQVNIADACSLVGDDLALWGNLDPVGVIARGQSHDVRAAARSVLEAVEQARHRRFVLSSGCTLAVETPPENLDVFFDTARTWRPS